MSGYDIQPKEKKVPIIHVSLVGRLILHYVPRGDTFGI